MIVKLRNWIDQRYPMTKVWEEHLSKYYAPKNFNFWYFFGSLAIVVLVIQIVTGIFLTMYYKPDTELAFASVEHIMRDVSWGWLMRYMHSTGASLFFVVIYLHMFRALLYGSYHKPRELLWIIGMVIYLSLMAEAFFGYLLPWGNMSYWGAQVIISLFGAIPFIGEGLAEWIRGDFVVSDATLTRFFAFHVILVPLLILGLVFVRQCEQSVSVHAPRMPETADHLREDQVPVPVRGEHPLDILHDGNRGLQPAEHVRVLLVERLAVVLVSVVSCIAGVSRPPDDGVGLARRTTEKHGSSSVFRPKLRDPVS